MTGRDGGDTDEADAQATLLERLRVRGWRVTPQRRAVAEVLTGDHVHLTAEEIHERARARLPEVSLATVYNTLRELVGMGAVLELRIGDGPARYDPNTHGVHHHLVCTSCGDLLDVYPAGVEQLRLSRGQRHGYAIDDVDVTFRGRCPRCAAKSHSPRADRGAGRCSVGSGASVSHGTGEPSHHTPEHSTEGKR